MIDLHQIVQFIIPVARAAEEPAASAGGAAVLGLNLKLFIGQLVNFAVLLFIFWKFILPKVTKALTERTARIEKSLTDASRIEKEKQEFAVWKQQEMSKARTESSVIVLSAQTEAVKAKDAIMQQAKEEQQKLVEQAKTQIESEKNKSIAAAKTELADLITSATEKILRKKLDSKSDQEYIKESLHTVK